MPHKGGFEMRNRVCRRLLILTLVFTLACGPALAAVYKTLRPGNSGPDVVQLQLALNQKGYSVGAADGKYGAKTETAVRNFQKNNNLKVDGIAGSQTQTLLYGQAQPVPTAAPVPTQNPSAGQISFGGNYSVIEKGQSGTRVLMLQTALNLLGYGRITVDGKFGNGTRNAVIAFQQANKLTADGKAGKKTLTKMEQLSASSVVTPVPTAAPTAVPTPVPTPTATAQNPYEIPTQTLRSGSQGEDVKSVQRRLKDLGYYTGSIDGKFGTGTLNALIAFQQANRLTADGAAGKRTYAVLYSADAIPASAAPSTPAPVVTNPPSGNYSTLKKGAAGTEVKRLQSALAKLDYTTSTYGVYENATAAAVRDFQIRNGLTADGIAGPIMQTKLYSGTAVRGTSSAGIDDGIGEMRGPSLSQVKLLHWFNDIKGTYLKSGQNVLVYDPVTGLGWTLYVMSCGRHADVEPKTALDTAIQYRAFGNREDWGPKAVYVQLPDGTWTIGGLANVAHNTQTIKNNNFNGQNCLHFLRDMAETQANDPKTGVANQNCIRDFWKELTGQEITN